jgi:hypothetical protein
MLRHSLKLLTTTTPTDELVQLITDRVKHSGVDFQKNKLKVIILVEEANIGQTQEFEVYEPIIITITLNMQRLNLFRPHPPHPSSSFLPSESYSVCATLLLLLRVSVQYDSPLYSQLG